MGCWHPTPSLHTRTQLLAFSSLFGLSAPLSPICSLMFLYSSQRYERLSSSSSSNGCLLRAERGYPIVTRCCNQWGGHLTRQELRETAAELQAFCILGPAVCVCVCEDNWWKKKKKKNPLVSECVPVQKAPAPPKVTPLLAAAVRSQVIYNSFGGGVEIFLGEGSIQIGETGLHLCCHSWRPLHPLWLASCSPESSAVTRVLSERHHISSYLRLIATLWGC